MDLVRSKKYYTKTTFIEQYNGNFAWTTFTLQKHKAIVLIASKN